MTRLAAHASIRRRAIYPVLVMAFVCCVGGAEAKAAFRFFSPSSFWNKALNEKVALASNSSDIVGALTGIVAAEKQEERGPSINTDRWSVPVYRVPANQPTVRVLQDSRDAPSLQAAWDAVPLPPEAQPGAGTDKHLVVWQPSSDKLWEFWHLEGTPSGWRAGWGGAMEHVSTNRGVYGSAAWPGASPTWGASASSLSIAGGLITLEDLKLGRINHALALAVPEVRAGVYAAPARRTDGQSNSKLSLPEGAHLRLDPNLNLDRLNLPRLTRMIAIAAQRYGILLRSRAGVVTFYGQDPTPTGSNPYTRAGGYFEGRTRLEIFGAFPWRHLQLLKMKLHREQD